MNGPKKKSAPLSEQILVSVFVFAFVGLLIAIAIPNYVGSPRSGPGWNRNWCISNLRQIDGAKEQWALEHHAKPGDIVSKDEIASYVHGGLFPKCPSGGVYTHGRVGENPKCSVPGHSL